jgi:predicted kinase
MPPPLLVIITGLPCTGKTTLARTIAAGLGLPLLAKDDIKERLFDSLGWSDREWSKKLGRATFDLLFYFIEVELRAGHSLIAEARFFSQYHLEVFQEMQQRQPFRPLVIECVADGEILLRRFIGRSESGERHPGHVDHTSYAEAEAVFLHEEPLPFDLGGKYIAVNTNDFSRVDPQELITGIRRELERGEVEMDD